MVLTELNAFRIQIADFLNIVLFQNDFIFLNIWSIVHLIAGVLLMLFILRNKLFKKSPLVWLTLFVVLFEVIEFPLHRNLTGLFIPETFVDIIWDIIVSVTGGLVTFIIVKPKRTKRRRTRKR